MAQNDNTNSMPSLTTGSVSNPAPAEPATTPSSGHGTQSTGTGSPSDASWMQSVASALMNMPTTPYVSMNAAGPNMKIDVDTVNNVISGWNQIHAQLQSLWQTGDALNQIQGPGADTASGDFANRANSAGSSHQWANKALSAAVQDHIDKLQAAVQQYKATDHGNAGNLNRQDS